MRPVSHALIQTSKVTMAATMMRPPRSPNFTRDSPSAGGGARAATTTMQIAATAPHHHGRRRYDIPTPIRIGAAITASKNPTSAICATRLPCSYPHSLVGGQARQPLRRPPEESGPPVLPVCEPTLQSPRLTYRHPYHRSSELQTSRKDAERFIEEVRGDDPEVAANLRIEERELEAGGGCCRCSRAVLLQPRLETLLRRLILGSERPRSTAEHDGAIDALDRSSGDAAYDGCKRVPARCSRRPRLRYAAATSGLRRRTLAGSRYGARRTRPASAQ